MSTTAPVVPAPSCASGVTYNGPTWQPTSVSWTIPAGATSTRVYLRNADGSETLLATTATNSATFPTHVRDGRYSGVRVVPFNSTGSAAGCVTNTITTYVLPCPSAYATAGSTTLQWYAVPGATQYRIYQRAYTVANSPDSTTNYTTTNTSWSPMATTKWEYRVVAEDTRYDSATACSYVRYTAIGGGGDI